MKKLYLAADAGIGFLHLYYGKKPPEKDIYGNFKSGSRCMRIGSIPIGWAKEHSLNVPPGGWTVINEILVGDIK